MYYHSQFAQQVRVDVVIRLRVARARLAVDPLQAASGGAVAPQVARHLPTAVNGYWSDKASIRRINARFSALSPRGA